MTKKFRECEQCKRKMAPGIARTPRDGKLLCGGCRDGREGRPLTGSVKEPMDTKNWKTAEAPFANIGGHMIRIAHQSGDSETIFHCPFCGSGQVIARSDGTTNCSFCFSGETEYITKEGVKTFVDTAGTTQQVLSSPVFMTEVGKGHSKLGHPKLDEQQVEQIRDIYSEGSLTKADLARKFTMSDKAIANIVNRKTWKHVGGGGVTSTTPYVQHGKWELGHSSFGGQWVEAEIQSFGVQPLMKVTMRRNGGKEKVVFATAEHRWWINPRIPAGYKYDHKRMVTTQELQPEDRLVPLFSKTRIRCNADTTPSPFGIAHGFTFGDGSLDGRGGAKVDLWGEKDKALLPYFSASRQKPFENKKGTEAIEIKDLPSFFKSFPDFNESISYLYGWLAGYFAADGSVSENGYIALSCANLVVLERVKTLCNTLGIGTYDITPSLREGFPGREPSYIYKLPFVASTLTSDFFVIPTHLVRFESRSGVSEQIGWTVVSVEETERVEKVYCAVVPEYSNFTLAGNVNVMNCESTFIVQIQPEQHSMPQTINGVPFQIPGMPPPSDPATDPAQPDPNEATESDHESFGGDDLSEKVDDKEEDSLADLNKGAMFITTNGMALPLADFEAHMALAHTANQEQTLKEVRRNRRD